MTFDEAHVLQFVASLVAVPVALLWVFCSKG